MDQRQGLASLHGDNTVHILQQEGSLAIKTENLSSIRHNNWLQNSAECLNESTLCFSENIILPDDKNIYTMPLEPQPYIKSENNKLSSIDCSNSQEEGADCIDEHRHHSRKVSVITVYKDIEMHKVEPDNSTIIKAEKVCSFESSYLAETLGDCVNKQTMRLSENIVNLQKDIKVAAVKEDVLPFIKTERDTSLAIPDPPQKSNVFKYEQERCLNGKSFTSKNDRKRPHRFSQSSKLKSHMLTHTGEKPYKCLDCSKSFTRATYLTVHERTHSGEKPYRCPECYRSFSQVSALNKHMLTHTGEKPYRCPECSKCFSQNGNLKQHMLIHSGEKPYRCLECNKCFTNSSLLKQHMLTHTGEKPYTCQDCNKSYTTAGSLKQHKGTHSGEKPFHCAECNNSCKTAQDLKVHARTHSGEKPYRCLVCNKCFSQSRNLKAHMLTHTGEKPYKCQDCNKSYTSAGSLKQHKRTHLVETSRK